MPKDTLSLYEITDELLELQHELIENGGVISDEMEERHDELLEMEAGKTDGYIAIIQNLTRTAEAVKAEEKRLKKRRKALESSVDSLKDRLRMAMDARGEEVRESTLGKVRVQTASRRGTTVFTDPGDLPEKWRRVKVSADKSAISEALQSEDLDIRAEAEAHAQLDEPTRYVQIY